MANALFSWWKKKLTKPKPEPAQPGLDEFDDMPNVTSVSISDVPCIEVMTPTKEFIAFVNHESEATRVAFIKALLRSVFENELDYILKTLEKKGSVDIVCDLYSLNLSPEYTDLVEEVIIRRKLKGGATW